jgi:hypothetical protein
VYTSINPFKKKPIDFKLVAESSCIQVDKLQVKITKQNKNKNIRVCG